MFRLKFHPPSDRYRASDEVAVSDSGNYKLVAYLSKRNDGCCHSHHIVPLLRIHVLRPDVLRYPVLWPFVSPPHFPSSPRGSSPYKA
jgi:hypothetical protein